MDLLTENEALTYLLNSIDEEGNQSNYARANGMSTAVISRVIRGEAGLSPIILNSLGLEKVTMYRVKEVE